MTGPLEASGVLELAAERLLGGTGDAVVLCPRYGQGVAG